MNAPRCFSQDSSARLVEHRYQVGQRREIRRKRYRVHGAKTGESAGTIAVPCRSCAPGLARDMKTPPERGALEHRQMGSNWTYRTCLATPFGGYPSWWGIVWSGS